MDMGVQLPLMETKLLLFMEMAALTLCMGLAVQAFRLLWFERCGVKAASRVVKAARRVFRRVEDSGPTLAIGMGGVT